MKILYEDIITRVPKWKVRWPRCTVLNRLGGTASFIPQVELGQPHWLQLVGKDTGIHCLLLVVLMIGSLI